MTNFKSLLALAFFMTSLLFGCSKDANDQNVLAKEVIASEKTLPTNVQEIAFETETTPLLVRRAVNQSEFEKTWDLYNFENKIPTVDFNDKDVFFIGIYESGSCPYKVKNVELSSDNNTMTVPLSEPEGACTADASPRTFVIQIDKEISQDIEDVVIVQGGVETNIPFEN